MRGVWTSKSFFAQTKLHSPRNLPWILNTKSQPCNVIKNEKYTTKKSIEYESCVTFEIIQLDSRSQPTHVKSTPHSPVTEKKVRHEQFGFSNGKIMPRLRQSTQRRPARRNGLFEKVKYAPSFRPTRKRHFFPALANYPHPNRGNYFRITHKRRNIAFPFGK